MFRTRLFQLSLHRPFSVSFLKESRVLFNLQSKSTVRTMKRSASSTKKAGDPESSKVPRSASKKAAEQSSGPFPQEDLAYYFSEPEGKVPDRAFVPEPSCSHAMAQGLPLRLRAKTSHSVPYYSPDHTVAPSSGLGFPIKVVSWNVNGLRAVMDRSDPDGVTSLVKLEDADVTCLQEIKISPDHTKDLEARLVNSLGPGWKVEWCCSTAKAGYSGTAMIIGPRVADLYARVVVDDGQDGTGPLADGEGRLLAIRVADVLILNSYVPNSGSGLVRLDHRVSKWDGALRDWVCSVATRGVCCNKPRGLRQTKLFAKPSVEGPAAAEMLAPLKASDVEASPQHPWHRKPLGIVWVGDLNVSRTALDIENAASNVKTAGFTPQERNSFANTLGTRAGSDEPKPPVLPPCFAPCKDVAAFYDDSNGGAALMTDNLADEPLLCDSFRQFFPCRRRAYTWWSYRTNGRVRNVGWRLDYAVVSTSLMYSAETLEIAGSTTKLSELQSSLHRCLASYIVPGWKGSDHCPVGVVVLVPFGSGGA